MFYREAVRPARIERALADGRQQFVARFDPAVVIIAVAFFRRRPITLEVMQSRRRLLPVRA